MKDNFVPPGPLTTPVLFMMFNRPDTTQKVFDVIKKPKPKQFFIAVDGPRPDRKGEIQKCQKAREIATSIDWNCEVKTLFRDKNLGCKIAVSSAIDWFFRNVEEGIILEDDCLPSQSFFWFCKELLEYYRDDTIMNNIAFGIPAEKIDLKAVEYAARISNLHHFIVSELPNGYQTIVGERGIRLSGGERQRVGIARALYHDPEVLVLDEATSSLDGITGSAVLEAISNVAKPKTVIIVAHRLTTVKDCDIIYLIDKGKITAQGTYDELMSSSAASFRAMAKVSR